MLQRQKETVLALLKSAEESRDYGTRYWFTYTDFLDPTDDFTAFVCENLEGKQGYLALIDNLLNADETAKIFVEVYGFEEDHNEQFIYGETLIIFSKLSLSEIEQIFNEPEDIFPDDIGELTDLSQPYFIVGANGDLVPAVELFNDDYSVYYCWWD